MSQTVRGIRKNWFPPIPDTGNKRSLVHVMDVVTAIQFAIRDPATNGKIFIIADKKQYSTREIYDGIRKILGKKPLIFW